MYRSFETVLIEQCAPTLAGVKPANLFRFAGEEQTASCVESWDRTLKPLGIRVVILKEDADACLVYVYRAAWLARLLEDPDHSAFLERIGYRPGPVYEMLVQLAKRLCAGQNYPHEIGIFLGYPLDDVIGFIQNRGRNYTCCGCWKAYGDPQTAQKRFACYRDCTALYLRRYAQGTPIIQLVVAA